MKRVFHFPLLDAPAMFGQRQGFSARVKDLNPQLSILHSLSRRRKMETVMKEIINIVNFIKQGL
jgi:hypothetical protein